MNEPFEIPSTWSWAAFEDVARVATDLVDPRLTPNAPHIAPNHIESGTGRLLPYATIAADGVTSSKQQFRRGQILYSKIRPYLAKVAIAPEDGLCSADMYPVEPLIETNFLWRWMLSPWFTNQAAGSQGRTVLPKINQDALAGLRVPVPPLNEQRRISARLEELLSRTRSARESLERLPALLDRMRQSVLASAFRGDLTSAWREAHPEVEPAEKLLERIRAERRRKWEEELRAKGKDPKKAKYEEPAPVDASGLPELPEGWCWTSLPALSWASGYGTSVRCDAAASGTPVLRIPNVAAGELSLADLKFATVDLNLRAGDELVPGDFLTVRTNGSRELVGRSAVVRGPLNGTFHFASYLIRHRLLGGPVLWDWVGLMIQSPRIRSTIEELAASSAGQYNVSLEKLAGLAIPLPPDEELRAASILLRASLQALAGPRGAVETAAERVTCLEQALLAKAFRGELVTQDPSDEPASTLLTRTREAISPDAPGAKRSRPKKTAASAEA